MQHAVSKTLVKKPKTEKAEKIHATEQQAISKTYDIPLKN